MKGDKKQLTNVLIVTLILINVAFFGYFGFKAMQSSYDMVTLRPKNVFTVKIIDINQDLDPVVIIAQRKAVDGGDNINLTVGYPCDFYNSDYESTSINDFKFGDTIKARYELIDKEMVAFSITKFDPSTIDKEAFPDQTLQSSFNVKIIYIHDRHDSAPPTMTVQKEKTSIEDSVNLTIDPDCNFYDSDNNPITIDSLKAGDILKITDSSSDGEVAFSIARLDLSAVDQGAFLTNEDSDQTLQSSFNVKIIYIHDRHDSAPPTMTVQKEKTSIEDSVNLTIDPDCNFYDSDNNPITIDSLKAGDILKITDSSSDGEVAFSIVKLEDDNN